MTPPGQAQRKGYWLKVPLDMSPFQSRLELPEDGELVTAVGPGFATGIVSGFGADAVSGAVAAAGVTGAGAAL